MDNAIKNSNQPSVRRFRLRTKVLAGTLGIVLSSLFLISSYFIYFYHQEIKITLVESLRVAKETYSKVSAMQVSRMKSVLASIRYSPRFVAAISVGMDDIATLQDSARTEFELSGVDLFLIMNTEGKPLVGLSSNEKDYLLWSKDEQALIARQNFTQAHLNEAHSSSLGLSWGSEEIYTDIIVFRNSLYRIISAPLYDRENNLLGLILLGGKVNREMVSELAKVTGADIGFLSGDGVFATSLSRADSEELKSFVAQNNSVQFELIGRICSRSSIRDRVGTVLGFLIVMKSTQVFQKKIYKLSIVSAGVISCVVLLAILISLMTSSSIVKPLQTLSSAFRSVGQGELNVSVKISSGDELETLSETFNEMVGDLKKKETMSKFLTGMALEEVDAISSGKKVMSMFGEKKELSILFSDIRSFTSICETTDAKVVINALNYYFDMLIPLIEANGGVLDKLIGDCIMAVFEDRDGCKGADNALRAAIAMQAKLAQIRPEMEKLCMPGFHAGFGINTGECVVGNVGTSNQLSRTVLGDGVNLAARVESLSKEGKTTCILFTEATRHAMEQKLEYEFLMETVVKGKSVPVGIYEISPRELASALQRLEEVNV